MADRDFDFPWFPFWAKDFLGSRKVRLMSPEEVGIYTLLLAHEWMDGPIGDDPDEWTILTQGADSTDVQRVLERCFELTDEGWVNGRLEEVRDEQIKKHKRLSRAGSKGAKARWSQGKDGNRNGDAIARPKRPQRQPESDTETEGSTSSSLRSSDGQTPDVENPGALWAPLIREYMWQGEDVPKHSPDGWHMGRAINCAKRLASEVGREELAGAIRMYRGPPCSLAAWYKRGNRGTLNELINKWRRSEADTVTPISELLPGTGTEG